MASVEYFVQQLPRISQRAQQMVVIVSAVVSAAQQGWSQCAESYVVQHVGTAGWSQLKRRWRTPRCKKLAALAARLDELGNSSDVSFLEKVPLVEALLKPVSPVASHAHQAAMLLRALGVAVCFAHGQLRQCACLEAIVDTSGAVPNLIVSSLYQAIPASRYLAR